MDLLNLIFFILIISFTTPFAVSQDTPSAYEVLQEYDFPVGLLPKGVTSYELNNETGKFSAQMNDACSFTIESYELKYKSTITGVISKDKLKNLKGISVKILFLWLNIVEVIRDGEDLEFSVGIASAVFPVDNFEECPECGCGFDCNQFNGILSSF
ncbi:Protein of unknown function, DUF538 [Melia azedarach]|nr:Protein of unknown function, DUF538 [Melia azedarach]